MDATASSTTGSGAAPGSGAAWTVVLPLKGGPAAKSRLAGPPGLAAALAADCLAAVLACPVVHRVLVVTADPDTAAWTASAGAQVVPERLPGTGPSAAARDGLAHASGPAAVLLGDLPALRPEDLATALTVVGQVLAGGPGQVVVPDAEGTGSVLLAALDPRRLTPVFGVGSAAGHRAAGALPLALDLPRLRRDVDTDTDLAQALALGCGPATLAVLAAARDQDGHEQDAREQGAREQAVDGARLG